MPNYDDTRYIKNYFRNRLSKKDRISFVERRKSDPIFAQLVEEYQRDLAAIHAIEHDALKQQALIAGKNGNGNRRWRRIIATAGVVWILIATGNWWISNTPSNTDELYAVYYETPIPSAPRNASEIAMVTWSMAVAAFSNQNYKMALYHYSELLKAEQFVAKSEVQFYIGICQMELEDYDAAINSFLTVSPKSKYSLDAKWYLSLAFLKAGQLEIAKSLLSDFSNTSGYKAPEAEMMILKLQDE